jgi:trans-aconitate methyltransferase
MDAYKETFTTWNKVASLYQDKFMDLTLYNETYDFIYNNISIEKAAILEIGCGPGNITRYLLAKRPDFNIYGIDIAPKMISLAEKNNPTAKFAVMDSRDINTLSSKYNGIIAGFCIPYLSPVDVAKLIADCNNLLLADGLLYISFVEGDATQSGYKSGSTGDRTYFYYHTLENIKQLLAANNFEAPHTFFVMYKRDNNVDEMHTILITNKKATT